MKEETKNIESKIVKLKGIVKFPFVEEIDGNKKFSCKLCLDNVTMDKVEKVCEELGEDIAVSEVKIEGEQYNGINVKTSFPVKVFDKEGTDLTQDSDYPIYDGAKAILKVQLKRYEYKEKRGSRGFTKTGVTGYLLGGVILEQGVPFANETTYDEFKDMLDENNENIEF